ncbi:MAG: hypothetical protein EP319_11305 [Deltaproteobacteria bacterium]|nr:MAG: hypothetical protein EP319_11305 [Deltaproteobacteria bacterium]
MRIILLCLLFSSCAYFKDQQKKSLKRKIKASPIQKLSYWDKYRHLPLEERIMPASKEMVELLLLQNELDGFPEIPKMHELTDEQREIIKAVVSHIPAKLKAEISKRLVGIMIVKDLGGTGLTDVVFEDKSKGYIVFDALIFSKKANEWCTWKESSPFKEGTYKLKCTLADDDQNTVEQAFEYILMHEIAHILNLNNPMLPFWIKEDMKKSKKIEEYPYLKQSWDFEKETYVHKTRTKYKSLLKVPYYRPDIALENEKMITAYQELGKTDFPSLYGVINPWDDFAESFVTYYHAIYHKRPWKIEIQREGKTVNVFTSCIQETRCFKKKKIIEDLYFK